MAHYRSKNLLNKNPGEINLKRTSNQLMRFLLRELKNRDIVECINENKRKNRVYRLTQKGQDIARFMD